MGDPVDIKCRKWTLFSFTLVAIILQIVFLILAINVINDLGDRDRPSGSTPAEWEDAKKLAKTIVIVIAVLSMLIQLLGLFGAYKENYCMTLTYAILMTIAVIANIFNALESASNWGSFAINLIIVILAYMFSRDIKRKNAVQHVQPAWTG